MTDPRIERTRRTVLGEALTELAERGYGGFTIESVAARSGVAKSTIYRHWTDRLALIADALETLNVQPATVGHPHGGGAEDGRRSSDLPVARTDPRARVHQLLTHLAEAFRDPVVTGCTPALIEAAEHDADVRAFHHRYAASRRRALVDALADGVGRGSFPPHLDPEVTSLALAGAIVYSRVMTNDPFDPADVPVLLDTVLGPHRG